MATITEIIITEEMKRALDLDLLVEALGDTSGMTDEELDALLVARGYDPEEVVAAMREIIRRHE